MENYRNLINALDAISKIDDSSTLLRLWAETRTAITELLEDSQPFQAAALSRAYAYSFVRIKDPDVQMIREIIGAFPANFTGTFRFLGLADDIDETIIRDKLRITLLSQTKDAGYCQVLSWALERHRTDLVGQVVAQVHRDLVDNHPGNQSAWREAYHGLIGALTSGSARMDLGGPVDDAVAALVIPAPDYLKPSSDILRLIEQGMEKTLGALLATGAFQRFKPQDFSADQAAGVMALLPTQPTPADLYRMLQQITVPGLREKILFDTSVDIDAYIAEMDNHMHSERRPGKTHDVYHIQSFCDLLTPEHLNTSARKSRAKKLLNAVCKEVRSDERDLAELRKDMLRLGFHDYTFKLINQLRGRVLEEELGM